MAEGGQSRSGPDRPDHVAVASIAGNLVNRLPGEGGRPAVDVEGLVAEIELAQGERRAAEAVGLDRIGAGLEIAEVDFRAPDRVATGSRPRSSSPGPRKSPSIERSRLWI